MSNQQQGESYLIQDVIYYGIKECQTLSMEKIQKESPKVGVLSHYQNRLLIDIQDQDQFFQMWAFPDGIKIYDSNLKVINDKNPQFSFSDSHNLNVFGESSKKDQPKNYIYSFVHTDYSLNRTYFSALCWHEMKYIPLKNQTNCLQEGNIYTKSLPKCTLWELQNNPFFIDQDHTLVYLPKVMIIGSKLPIFTFHRQILKFYYRNVLAHVQNPLVNCALLDYFMDLINVAGYPQAEIEFDDSHAQFIKRSSKNVQVQRTYLQKFYTSFLFLPKITNNTGHLQIIDCSNSTIKFSPLQLGTTQCFKKPNIDIINIIKKVGVKNLICLWKCVLLQKHILVFSMNNNLVVQLFETLFYLIQPIKWQNIYIPFLPLHLVSNIDAIQSYLIGMSKIHMDYVIEHFEHQMKDIVLYDLDQNILLENTAITIELPGIIKETIETRLFSLGFKKDKLFSSLFNESSEERMTQTQKCFRIKLVFFDSLIYLLNNYRPFASLKEGDILGFNRQGYTQIFQQQEWRKFAQQLTETMIFVRLCEYHLYEQKILKWNQQSIGGLFVYCQNIISSKCNKQQFWNIPKYNKGSWKWSSVPYFQYISYVYEKDMKHIKQNKKIYRVQSYMVKYIGWLEMQQQQGYKLNLFNKKKQSNRQKHTLFKSFIEFIFPWISELELDQQRHQADVSISSKINDCDLLELDCLFKSMRKGFVFQDKNDLKRTMQAYRERKYNFLDTKKLGERIYKLKQLRERISV